MGSVYARHPEINGFRAEVQTVLSYTIRSGTEKFIAPWSSEPADNIDLSIRISHRIGQFLKYVVDSGIEMAHFTGAVVAQEVVEFRDRFGNVFVSSAKHDVESFAGMCVKQV